MVTSPRDNVMNHPWKIVRSQHGQAVMTKAARDGSSFKSDSFVNGT